MRSQCTSQFLIRAQVSAGMPFRTGHSNRFTSEAKTYAIGLFRTHSRDWNGTWILILSAKRHECLFLFMPDFHEHRNSITSLKRAVIEDIEIPTYRAKVGEISGRQRQARGNDRAMSSDILMRLSLVIEYAISILGHRAVVIGQAILRISWISLEL